MASFLRFLKPFGWNMTGKTRRRRVTSLPDLLEIEHPRNIQDHQQTPGNPTPLMVPSYCTQIHLIKNPVKIFMNTSRTPRTQPNNQTHFSRCFRTQNSTYNIPKRREKHALQHGIIKIIKQSRLQKFIFQINITRIFNN